MVIWPITFVEAQACAPLIGRDLIIVIRIAMIQEWLNAVFEDFQRSNETR